MSVADQFRADCGTTNFDVRSYKGPRFPYEIKNAADAELYIKFLDEAPVEVIFPQSSAFRLWRRLKFRLGL